MKSHCTALAATTVARATRAVADASFTSQHEVSTPGTSPETDNTMVTFSPPKAGAALMPSTDGAGKMATRAHPVPGTADTGQSRRSPTAAALVTFARTNARPGGAASDEGKAVKDATALPLGSSRVKFQLGAEDVARMETEMAESAYQSAGLTSAMMTGCTTSMMGNLPAACADIQSFTIKLSSYRPGVRSTGFAQMMRSELLATAGKHWVVLKQQRAAEETGNPVPVTWISVADVHGMMLGVTASTIGDGLMSRLAPSPQISAPSPTLTL